MARNSPEKRKRGAAPRGRKRTSTAPAFSRALQKEISTVLVTGAGGCVGSLLVGRLLRAGYRVIALDRRGMEIPPAPGNQPLSILQGDPAEPGFPASALQGVDAVFHAGGHGDGEPLFFEPDPAPVTSTRRLYDLSRKAGVKRFVLISSSEIYARTHAPVTEEGPLEARHPYAQARIEMERTVLDRTRPGLPAVTVLRAARVYGPRCRAATASLATLPALVRSLGPHYIPHGPDGPRVHLVHGDDVARAALFLLLHPKAYGEVFNVADNAPLGWGNLLDTAMEAYGLTPLEPGTPYPPGTLLQSILPEGEGESIFDPLGEMSALLWERMIRKHGLNKALQPTKGRRASPLGGRDMVVDTRKLKSLGFRLRYPRFPRGWEKTLAWYQRARWVPPPEDL